MSEIIGTLHAERGNVKIDHNKVRLYSRYWDGIDHPDYTTIKWLSADDARHLAQQLFAAAEAIDGKSKKDRTSAKIRRNTEEIAKKAKKEALA